MVETADKRAFDARAPAVLRGRSEERPTSPEPPETEPPAGAERRRKVPPVAPQRIIGLITSYNIYTLYIYYIYIYTCYITYVKLI